MLYINHTQQWFHDPKNWNDREKLFPWSVRRIPRGHKLIFYNKFYILPRLVEFLIYAV
jgi:hypothetical protein